jgi:hypothetical protein
VATCCAESVILDKRIDSPVAFDVVDAGDSSDDASWA